MPTLLHVVANAVSEETVQVLRGRAAEAADGDIIGVAIVALRKGRRYSLDIVGEARFQPAFTRGIVNTLDDHLADIIRPER